MLNREGRDLGARWAQSPDSAALTALAVAVVLIGCVIVAWAARRSTFTADDWSFVLGRRGFNATVILSPDNEHLAALPILAFKALLGVFGLSSYVPFTTLLIVVHGIASLLLYAIARRYVGSWVALLPTAIFVVLGPAWHVLVFYASITFVASLAPGLGMVLCLERRDRIGDIGAGVLLGVSLLCSSVGLAMVVFAVVMIVLQRPTAWRRLWAVAVPVALYLLWYAHYGVSTAKGGNIPHIPGYVFDAASAAVASVTGLGQTHLSPYLVSPTYGRVVLVIAAAFFILQLRRGLRPPAITWAALLTALALWVAEGLEYFPGGREATQSRYQYVGGALVLLIVVTAAKDWRPGRVAGRILVVATLAVCAANLAILHGRVAFWAMNSSYDRAETGALEVARGFVPPAFAPENFVDVALMGDHNLTVVNAGQYFSAVDEWGSSAYRPRQILRQAEDVRESADLVVAAAERVGPRPASGAAPAGCRPVGTVGAAGGFAVAPGATIAIASVPAPGRLAVRRFASSFRYVHWTVPAHTAVIVRLPADHTSLPWHARLLDGAAVRICATQVPRG